MAILRIAFFLLRDFLLSRSALAAENLALRQQVAVYKHTVKRPRLRPRDRIFWVLLSRLWANWRSALAIVNPKRSSNGTGKDSSSTGDGSRGPVNADALPSNAKSVT